MERKHSKEEFDRLMETSPPISEKIVKKFKKTFADGIADVKGELPENLTSRQQTYLDLKKPEICGTMESTAKSVYKLRFKEGTDKYDAVRRMIEQFRGEKGRDPTVEEVVDELDDLVDADFVRRYLEGLHDI